MRRLVLQSLPGPSSDHRRDRSASSPRPAPPCPISIISDGPSRTARSRIRLRSRSSAPARRHGRQAWDFGTPIPGRALGESLRGEGEAPLDASSRPSAELERLSKEAKCLVASPLRRSRDSARLLAPTTSPLVDPCFREAELPSAIQSGLRLRPEMWALLARTAWFCGWSAGVESFQDARDRAAQAA